MICINTFFFQNRHLKVVNFPLNEFQPSSKPFWLSGFAKISRRPGQSLLLLYKQSCDSLINSDILFLISCEMISHLNGIS